MKYIISLICLIYAFNTYGQARKNIIIIISDDHAFQTIGAYGATYGNTPNIDRLAHEGAVFNRAYVNNSICGPSRAALLTGKYSHKNGFKDNETSNFDHTQDLFVKRLQESGYQTAWVGKLHLGHNLKGFSYYSILPEQGHYYNPDFITATDEGNETNARENGYVSDIVTDKALDWIDEQQDNPFCIVIGHKATHRTWMPDTSDFGLYDSVQIDLPDTYFDQYETRNAAALQEMSIMKDMRLKYDLKMYDSLDDMRKEGNFKRMNEEQIQKYWSYYSRIKNEFDDANLNGEALAIWKFKRYMIDYLNTAQSLDRNIGRVLDYLKINNLEENTLVIYLSDQGFYMGEHGWFDKRFMYEESFRTPMLARLPNVIKPGSKIEAQVMNVDIAPTILELAGVPIPEDIQGRSFLNVMKGTSKSIRDAVYYHYYENGEHAVSPHFGISDGRYKLIRFYKRIDSWELFDMERDPKEMQNVYNNPKYRSIQRKLTRKLADEIEKLDDDEARLILENKISNR